eukprot:1157563-Pelagomonas_calceolata.AAC.11
MQVSPVQQKGRVCTHPSDGCTVHVLKAAGHRLPSCCITTAALHLQHQNAARHARECRKPLYNLSTVQKKCFVTPKKKCFALNMSVKTSDLVSAKLRGGVTRNQLFEAMQHY